MVRGFPLAAGKGFSPGNRGTSAAAFGLPDDVLICLTTSGNSKNVIRAFEEAKTRKLKTIALLGRDGGSTAGMADVDLLVAGDSTARIQEAHQLLLHVLCETVEAGLPESNL